MATFQRNAIIAGYINSYCLVCECFFESEEQTFSHIRNEEHKRTLQSYPQMEKYGNNGIRKVKVGYFCEHCSLLMATAAKVNLHISDKHHYYNKGNMLLKQSGSMLTAFDDVLISESAWHSFSEDTCAMCDVEFDDANEHKNERPHVLKLLQNKVEFGKDNNIYRKIDKNNFQCLICNCLVSSLDEHFNDDTHNQNYVQCQEEKKKYDLANPKENKVKENKTEIKDSKQKYEEKDQEALNNITVTGKDLTKETIKKADIQTPPKLEQTAKITADLNKTPKKPDTTDGENSDLVTYAKDNKLAYDPRNANAFCKICEKKFPSTFHSMKEHVQGRDHINKTAKAAAKPASKNNNLKKRTLEDFVTSVGSFANTLGNDTVINESICIPENSIHLLTKTGSRFAEYKCQICLVNVSDDDLDEHCKTVKHEKGMRQTPIIVDLKNEFIREVHPDNFHCGFCNLMISTWKGVEEHIKTAAHKASAAACSRRLQIHLPVIRARKNDDKAAAAFFEMFVHHMT